MQVKNVIPAIAAREDELVAWRRDIHAHPELGFEELRTSELVARLLDSWGIEVHRDLGGTGVVGVIRAGNSPRSIGLRADMDALPIEEANGFAHRSCNAGVMHACGHDGHTAMLLGAARYLAETRCFDGTVVLVFQPAEEGKAGSAAMIRDGLLARFPMQAIYGLHNWPGLPAGRFGIAPGPVMASADRFDITLTGKGAHAAMPHQGSDTVLAGAQLVSALQMISARETDPLDAAVVSVTGFHAGEAFNVMPEEAHLFGTVRALRPETQTRVLAAIQRICEGVALSHGVASRLVWREGSYPATINSPVEAGFCRELVEACFGEEALFWAPPPSMGAEDFAFYLQQVPGCYVWLGSGAAEGGCTLHNPAYDFNDEILTLGASFWGRLVEHRLAR